MKSVVVFRIDRRSGVATYLQIVRQVEQALRMGALEEGDRLPTAAARRSLTAVLAVLAGVGGLNPTGTTHFVNPVDGATADVATISGHRDWMATECPGDLFHPQLPQLRLDVAARMG